MFSPSAIGFRFCLYVAGLVELCVGEQFFLSDFSASVECKAMSSSDIMANSPYHRLNLMLIKDHRDRCSILYVCCHQIKRDLTFRRQSVQKAIGNSKIRSESRVQRRDWSA